jgi:hypothetical protein
VHQERLYGIARCGVIDLWARKGVGESLNGVHIYTYARQRSAYFCVHDDTLRLVRICGLVEVDRAESIGVAHDGYARAALDLAHERVAPARYDEVDVPVLREQRGDFGASFDGLYECAWEGASACKGGLDRAC